MVIDSAASLTVAESLGNRLAIINGSVTVTNSTAANMDATKLAAVVAKMGTITGKLTYSHSGTGVTSVDFTKLTSAGSLEVDQSAALSFPELATTGLVTLTLDNKVTSVSFPKLVSLTSFNGHAISASKATSVDLSSLVRYGANLSITSDEGNVNLSSFVNTNSEGVATSFSLTLSGAETLTAPLLTSGAVDADDLTSVDLPKWAFYPGSSFDSATTITLPSVTGQSTAANSTIDLTADAPKAETVNITAAAKVVSTALTTYIKIDAASHTSLKSLTLDGAFADIDLATASKLDQLTVTGTANDVTISGTDLDELTLGYTPAARKTDLASLTVNANLSLTSFTGTLLNDLGSLSINGNTKLETLSLPALKTAGTTTDAVVDIQGNKLVIDNIQQPTSGTTVPVVTKAITSADFGPLKAYLDDAVTQVGDDGSIIVIADDVLKSTSTTGVVTEDPTDSDDHTIMRIDMSVASNAKPGKALIEEFSVENLVGDATFTVNGFVSTITNGASNAAFDLAAWASNTSNVAGFTAAGVTVSTGKSFYTGAITWTQPTATDNYYELKIDGETFSVTGAAASSTTQVAQALQVLVDGASSVLTDNSYTSTGGAAGFALTTTAKGSAAAAVTYSINAYESTTKATPVAITATANPMTQPSTYGYIRVVSAPGLLAAHNSTVTGAAQLSATLLTSSGGDTDTNTLGDNEAVQLATDDTASTVTTAEITAARVDKTEFLGS